MLRLTGSCGSVQCGARGISEDFALESGLGWALYKAHPYEQTLHATTFRRATSHRAGGLAVACCI